MNITILTVGAKPKAEISLLIESFTKRLPSHIKLTWHFLKHGGHDDPQKSITTESENIMRMIPDGSKVILLDETGKNLTSNQLSEHMFDQNSAGSDLVFVIGGAYGVSNELKERANVMLALGKLVYPHQLVRLILAEQIYRAHCIHTSHPYHHQ